MRRPVSRQARPRTRVRRLSVSCPFSRFKSGIATDKGFTCIYWCTFANDGPVPKNAKNYVNCPQQVTRLTTDRIPGPNPMQCQKYADAFKKKLEKGVRVTRRLVRETVLNMLDRL